MPWETESFLREWEIWKTYKKQQHQFTFKGDHSEQAQLVMLSRLSGGIESTAIQIIRQSISNGWAGLFELKNTNNGKHTNAQNGMVNGDYARDLASRMAKLTSNDGNNGY